MNARVVLSVVMCACACGDGSAGRDAGTDGECQPIPYIADLQYPFGGPRDALVGQTVTAAPVASVSLPPTRCLEYSARGAGMTAPVTVDRTPDGSGGERVTFTFVPPAPAWWTLSVTGVNPGSWRSGWSLSVQVLEPVPVATPCATVNRACAADAVVGERVLCDDTMFDFSGTTVATLDGGLWFGERASMFAWSDGWVSPATPSGAVLRDGGVPMGRPLHWFTDDRTLVVGTDAGVFVMDVLPDRLGPSRRFGADLVDPFAAGVWDAGVVVLAPGMVCIETRCRELPEDGLRHRWARAFSASQLVYDAVRNLFTGHTVVTRLDGLDAAPVELAVEGKGLVSSTSDRRLIERSIQGLYALDPAGQRLGMPMGIPPDFLRARSSESHVWVVSPGRTDVYCQ